MSTTDVDLVATDDDLTEYTLGRAQLQALIPEDSQWYESGGSKSAKRARQTAFDNTLKSLRNRRPPILETQLVDVTELKQAVCYGALEILYRGQAEYQDSPNAKKASDYAAKYKAEVIALQPEVAFSGVASSGISIRLSRG